jgi:hypothetical protein
VYRKPYPGLLSEEAPPPRHRRVANGISSSCSIPSACIEGRKSARHRRWSGTQCADDVSKAPIRENSECYIVCDANGVTLAWLFCWDDSQRYSFGASKLNSEEARRIGNARLRQPDWPSSFWKKPGWARGGMAWLFSIALKLKAVRAGTQHDDEPNYDWVPSFDIWGKPSLPPPRIF